MTEQTKADDGAKGAKILSDAERAVDVSEIPLPPEALIDDLDNTGGAGGAAPAKPDATPKDTAELDYVDGPEQVVVPLTRPFRLDGRAQSDVTVRPLSVVETGRVMRDVANPDVFDFYAAMTGLPAAVIRGMRGVDGEAVTEAGYGFLPRFMRGGG